MTQRTGMLQEYINTVADKRMVTDRILMQSPYDIVAYLALGTNVGKFNLTNSPNYTYEWLYDTFNPSSDVVATGLASDSTTTTFTATTAALFQPGDVLLVDSEQMWVSAVATPVVTVTRGYGSTTKVIHANSSTAYLVSRARIPGDDADDSPHTDVASNYNYTQILQRTVNIDRTKKKMPAYGISDWKEYLIDKNMSELMILLSKMPYYGKRYVGTSSIARSAGGLRVFVTDNLTYATSTAATGGTASALTRKHIDDTLQNIWNDGGNPDLIITGGWAQRKLNDMYEGFVTTERSEQMGGINIKKLLHPISGTNLDVLVDRWCPTNELWILSRENIAYYPFDPFFYEELAKTGDAEKGEIVGEYGFICQFDKSHGAVLEFSTTA